MAREASKECDVAGPSGCLVVSRAAGQCCLSPTPHTVHGHLEKESAVSAGTCTPHAHLSSSLSSPYLATTTTLVDADADFIHLTLDEFDLVLLL